MTRLIPIALFALALLSGACETADGKDGLGGTDAPGGSGGGGTGGHGGSPGGSGGSAVLHSVESLEPDEGWVGTRVIVRGSGFPSIAGRTRIKFGPAESVVEEADQDGMWLATWVPSGAETGPVSVLADLGQGTVRVDGPVFTVTVRPASTLASIDPPVAYEGVPTRHRVTGDSFAEDSVAYIDGSPVSSVYVSSSEMSFDAPALAPGTYGVFVRTPFAQDSNVIQLVVDRPLDLSAAFALSGSEFVLRFEGGSRPTSIPNLAILPELEVLSIEPDTARVDSWVVRTEPQSRVAYHVYLPSGLQGPDGRPLRQRDAEFVGYGGLPRARPALEGRGCDSRTLYRPVAVSAVGSMGLWVTEELGNQLQGVEGSILGAALGVTAAGFGPLTGSASSLGCPEGSSPLLASPRGAVVTGDGSVLIFADTAHGRIVRFGANGLETIASDLSTPMVLGEVSGGRVVVGTGDDQLLLLRTTGEVGMEQVFGPGFEDGQVRLGIGDGGTPQVVSVGATWYLAEPGNHRLQRFDGMVPSGWIGSGHEVGFEVGGVATPGSGPSQFDHPAGVAVDAVGRILVLDGANGGRIQRFAADGTFVDELYLDGLPSAVAVDRRNTLWVPFPDDDRVVPFLL